MASQSTSFAISPRSASPIIFSREGQRSPVESRGALVLVLIATWLTAPLGHAETVTATYAYIPDITANTVSVVDTGTHAVLKTIRSTNFRGPFGVAVSPDGTQVWVTSNDYGAGLTVLETASNSIIRQLGFRANYNPWSLAFTPDGGSVWVALENNCTSTCPVAIIDTHTFAIDTSTIRLPGQPVAVAFTPDGSVGYVTYGGGQPTEQFVEIINVASKQRIGTVRTGLGASGVTVSPDGGTIYVVNQNADSISYFARGVTSGTASSFSLGAGAGPECIAVSPDGRTGYVTRNFVNGNTVQVVNLATKSAIGQPTVDVGRLPFGINVTPDGSTVVVATGQGVWNIDAATNRATLGYGPSNAVAFGNFIRTARLDKIQGDFNGDGRDDYALLGSAAADVYLSNGDGTFTGAEYDYPSGWIFGGPPSGAWTPIAADFNGDGKTDFAMLGSTAAYAFLSSSVGSVVNFATSGYTFPSGVAFGVPPSLAWTPVVGDFNGDGKKDFAMLGSTAAYVFLSTSAGGSATFTVTAYGYPGGATFGSPPTASWVPVVGDFDGNGKADFAMLGSVSANVFLSTSAGGVANFLLSGYAYPSGQTFGYPPSATWTPIVGDFNGDGRADFAMVGSVSANLFLSTGAGSFTPKGYAYPNGWSFGYPPSAKNRVVTGNFDRVGGTDFLFAGTGAYYSFLGDGTGAFAGKVH